MYTLRDLGFDPFVMVYDKENAPKQTKQLQRYVNNKIIFRSPGCKDFGEYYNVRTGVNV